MTIKIDSANVNPWTSFQDEHPENGYGDNLNQAIADGLEDMKAGRLTPAEQVWKKLGIE